MASETAPESLTVAEQDILNEFLGQEGCFLQTVLQHQNFSIGCKIIYLQRSINLSCHVFLNTLDTLYNPAQPESLSFIRLLKHINDLYFNNQIAFQVQGRTIIKFALDHFFGQVSQEIQPKLFQKQIKQYISDSIESLKLSISPGELKRQLAQQLFSEKPFFLSNPRWRNKANLPLSQIHRQEFEEYYPIPPITNLSELQITQVQEPIIQKLIYFGVLSPEECLKLTPIQFKMLTDYHINELLYSKSISIEERLGVETQAQIDNIILIYSSFFEHLDLSFTEVLALTTAQCRAIQTLTTYISFGFIQESLRSLLILNDDQLENLRTPSIIFLILGQVLSFQEAIDLSSVQRQKIQRGDASSVVREIKYQRHNGCCIIS